VEGFDVVVAGSGFGEAVTSSRLAEAGMDVAVPGRGTSYLPGSLPSSMRTLVALGDRIADMLIDDVKDR